jgi:deoxyribonuclease V
MVTRVEPWPAAPQELIVRQQELARTAPEPWAPVADSLVGGCFLCFGRGASGPGAPGEPGWAAAALVRRGELVDSALVTGEAGWRYEPGLLALREGPLLEAAARALPQAPELVLVDATGRDHPRRAGLALHLGAVLGVPTIGVTHRPLAAKGAWPPDETGARSPLTLEGEVVGYWVRTRAGTRPLAVHAAWRTEPDAAAAVVLACVHRARTPEPLRQARRVARTGRAHTR